LDEPVERDWKERQEEGGGQAARHLT
jgi:hypothetical protein